MQGSNNQGYNYNRNLLAEVKVFKDGTLKMKRLWSITKVWCSHILMHREMVTYEKIKIFGWGIIPHLYSSDLTPADLHLFWNLQKMVQCFDSKPKDLYKNGCMALVNHQRNNRAYVNEEISFIFLPGTKCWHYLSSQHWDHNPLS